MKRLLLITLLFLCPLTWAEEKLIVVYPTPDPDEPIYIFADVASVLSIKDGQSVSELQVKLAAALSLIKTREKERSVKPIDISL